MEVISDAPQANSFVPLIEHQSATPASFYSGPPVLHYYSQRCKVIIFESDIPKSPALQTLAQGAVKLNMTNGNSVNEGSIAEVPNPAEVSSAQKIISDIDVWVTSEKLLLYSPSSEIGVSIPYPTISLHAIQSLPVPSTGEQQGLYMQLASQPTDAEAEEEDDEEDSMSLTIVPQNDAPPPPTETDPESRTDDHSPQPPTVAMFTALSNCSNLHPDPVSDEEAQDIQGSALFQAGMIAPGDSSGGLPPPMPGSGGWITAENMGEYFDEEGNWIGGDEAGEEQSLGAGAGSVRPREDEDDETAQENGIHEDTKWRRIG